MLPCRGKSPSGPNSILALRESSFDLNHQCSKRRRVWSSFCCSCFLFLTPATAYVILVFMARCFFDGSASKTSSSTGISQISSLLGGKVVRVFCSQQLGWVNGESSSGRVIWDLKWRESAALEPCILLHMMHCKSLRTPAPKEQRVTPVLRVTARVVCLVGAIAKTKIDDED